MSGNDPTEGVDFAELKQAALDNYWMPFTQYNDMADSGGPMFIVEGDGIRLKDSEGKSYIDGIGGLFLVNVGHGRKEIVDAVTNQLNHLHYASTFSYANIPAVKLAQRIAGIAPGDLNKVFFASGGSEAVETALKIARQYHVNNGEPQRTKIIARKHSYHGVSLGALSVNTSAFVQRSIWEPMLAQVRFVGNSAEEVEELVEFEGPDTFAAFITEPISISKGVVVPPDDYWPKLREICDKHGILLIADEVINGFGRTGKMFAMEHWGVTPDMMTFAKGVTSGYQPVGGVVARPGVSDAFVGDHAKTFTHGYTYSGHPASAAAGLANLDIIEGENLVQNAAEMGSYMMDQLSALKEHSIVKEVRGIGLLMGMEMVKDKAKDEPFEYGDPQIKSLNKKLMSKGLLTRAEPYLYVSPPLTITKSEADEMISIIAESISEVEQGN